MNRLFSLTAGISDERGVIISAPVISYAEKHRREMANRAQVIAWLGLKPEGDTAADRYAATTSELVVELRERAKAQGYSGPWYV